MEHKNPLAIANFFIEKQKGIDRLSLQKYCYLSHGFKLGLLGLEKGSMSDEPVEAWKYGPVFPTVYQMFKYLSNTDQPVTVDCTLSKTDKQICEIVWKIYKDFTAWQLVDVTHRKDGPWHKVFYNNEGDEKPHFIIDNSNIARYFKETYFSSVEGKELCQKIKQNIQ